jgi:hypothetical protein
MQSRTQLEMPNLRRQDMDDSGLLPAGRREQDEWDIEGGAEISVSAGSSRGAAENQQKVVRRNTG